MTTKNRLLIGLLAITGVIAGVVYGRQEPTVGDVDALVRKELPLGSDAHQIENFFHRHRLAFSYDGFTDRYLSLIRQRSLFFSPEGILIELYLNKGQKLERIEVEGQSTLL